MKMYCIFIFIFLSVNALSLKAYLFVGYGLKSPTNQKIFLLGDCHTRMGLNFEEHERVKKYQFEAMFEIIQETEALSYDKKMKIFIENPHENILDSPSWETPKEVLHGLLYYTKDLTLQNSTLEDCDIRKVSGAAAQLLCCRPERVSSIVALMTRWDRYRPGGPIDWVKGFGCRLDILTFQDLLDNHAIWIRQCELYMNSWESASIRKAFSHSIIQSHSGLRMFIQELAKEPPIDMNERICEYSIRYWSSHDRRPSDVIFGLVEAFLAFLDMYTLHRILLLQNDPCYNSVIVCTGSSHSYNIYEALKMIGYRDICDPIEDHADWPPPPLAYDYLKKLLLPIEELEAGLTRTSEVPTEESAGCIVM